jgi:hypothetical protein
VWGSTGLGSHKDQTSYQTSYQTSGDGMSTATATAMATTTTQRETTLTLGLASAASMRLIMAAHAAFADAEASSDPLERFASAHLAALRAAAALLADRDRPARARPRRPTSAWTLLARVAPEMEPWATYFAAGANKRAAAESGLRGAVTSSEADELMRDATAFIGLVEATLGMLSLASAGMAAAHGRQ